MAQLQVILSNYDTVDLTVSVADESYGDGGPVQRFTIPVGSTQPATLNKCVVGQYAGTYAFSWTGSAGGRPPYTHIETNVTSKEYPVHAGNYAPAAKGKSPKEKKRAESDVLR